MIILLKLPQQNSSATTEKLKDRQTNPSFKTSFTQAAGFKPFKVRPNGWVAAVSFSEYEFIRV